MSREATKNFTTITVSEDERICHDKCDIEIGAVMAT